MRGVVGGKRPKGFTLIEVCVALLLLGVVVAGLNETARLLVRTFANAEAADLAARSDLVRATLSENARTGEDIPQVPLGADLDPVTYTCESIGGDRMTYRYRRCTANGPVPRGFEELSVWSDTDDVVH